MLLAGPPAVLVSPQPLTRPAQGRATVSNPVPRKRQAALHDESNTPI